MSLLVKDDGKKPPESVSTARKSRDLALQEAEEIRSLVKQFDEQALWDAVKSKDIPAAMLDFVRDKLEEGWELPQIRRQMGIPRSNDKSWTKILAALKAGFRVDGTAFLVKKAAEFNKLSNKLKDQIEDAFKDGVPMLVKFADGTSKIERVHGPTKELSMAIDTWNRLQQGFVKMGQDLGAFVVQEGKGGGGTTIVVQNNIGLPDQKAIDVDRERKLEKAKQQTQEALIVHESKAGVPRQGS